MEYRVVEYREERVEERGMQSVCFMYYPYLSGNVFLLVSFDYLFAGILNGD